MATDISLLTHALSVLVNLDGVSLPTATLAAEIEIRAHRPLTTDQVLSGLQWLRDHGYAKNRQDEFGRVHWWISSKGRNKHEEGF